MSKYVKLGSQFQVNVADGGAGGIAGNQSNPRITVLPDGRFVVVYQSDYAGNSADIDPKVMVFNADGSFAMSVPFTPYSPLGLQTTPVVAPRADGGFGLVFVSDRNADGTTDASGTNIIYVPVSAALVAGTAVAIADFDNFQGVTTHDALLHPAIATLSDGRQVIAFEQIYTSGTDNDIRLNVVGADGATLLYAATAGQVVDNNGGLQTDPAVAATGTTAMIVYRDAAGVSAKIFSGSSNTLGGKISISSGATGTASVTALDDHRFLVTYNDVGGVQGKIYDTSTANLSSSFVISASVSVFAVSVSVTSDGGFVATYAANADIYAHRFNSQGVAIGSEFLVNSFADGTQSAPAIAASGDHLLVAWNDSAARSGDGSPTSIQAQAFTLASSGSFAGVVSASDVSRKAYNIFPAAPLFSTSGFDGDAVVKYQFYDSTPAGGSWTLHFPDGLDHNQPANQVIDVSRDQLATAKFYVGAIGETDDLWVRASDGVNWSPWKEFHLTGVNQKPVVTPTAAGRTATHNQVFAGTSLFNAADGDGDNITQYEVWDTGGNGHWTLNGTPLAANTANRVLGFQLGSLTYQAGGGTDQLYVRAHDGYEWGAWTSAFAVTGPANNKPTVGVVGSWQNHTLAHNETSVRSTLPFFFADSDNDTITKFSLWDTEGNGAWVVNGVRQAANTEIIVSATDFYNNTLYVPGAPGSTDHLYLRVFDGTEWSNWSGASSITAGLNQKPVATPTAASRTVANHATLNATDLFTAADGDNDTITGYSLWDTGGSGRFIYNGSFLDSDTELFFLPSQISQVIYVSNQGTDKLYVRVNDGREWSNWTQAFTITGSADTKPVVTPTAGSTVMSHGVMSLQASTLFTYADAESDPIFKYSLWDTEGNGHFVVNGVVKPAATEIVVTAAELAQTTYVSGAPGTTDHLYVRAYDGLLWSDWTPAFTVTAGANSKPVLQPHNITLNLGAASDRMSSIFTVTDADHDTITKYQLWDSTADPGSSYWFVGGARGANVTIDVDASQDPNPQIFLGNGNLTDELWARAYDGVEWSAWVKASLTAVNHKPSLSSGGQDVNATHNQNLAASSLFQFSSGGDGDSITNYELWDSTTDSASGHWVVGGVAQGANVTIAITAAQLASTSFQSGSGSDDLWVRAYDGGLWSDWKEFHVNAPVNTKPVVTGMNIQTPAGTAVNARSLFTETDANNDTMTAYQFWDDNAGATSGYFIVNGEVQMAGRNIDVTAAQLAQASFVPGSLGSADKIYERAFDGMHWSDWQVLTVTAI